ncbi:ACT domain-containing protein [Azospirillum griseum]|uniref:ACT domain-containing protein n=2 Tax=Azospirillum griseum TaxID=2496639 RepID=A0A431VMV5_9PROT|nr:ACT domain-containing protein [Azospirillum griseum]RTR23713.1 ACT domain-containing protein [Azospirillum griseum]
MAALSRAGELAGRLARGDHRGDGDAAAVAADITAHPDRLPDLVECLFSRNAVVRMRAAAALERLSRADADRLAPYGDRLLREGAAIDQAEVRWRLAQMLPRLPLDEAQRRAALDCLSGWFEGSSSRIVRSSALQAVVDLAASDAGLRTIAADMLSRAMRSGVPSLVERARRILKPFEVDEATLTAALTRAPTGLSLTVLPDRLAVAQLPPGTGLPSWLDWTDPLVGATRTGEALSILCPEARIPAGVAADRGWRAFRVGLPGITEGGAVAGRGDAALFGVLAAIAAPLAQAQIPLFAMSTAASHYVLVRADDLERAAAILATGCAILWGDEDSERFDDEQRVAD